MVRNKQTKIFPVTHVYAKFYKTKTGYENWQARYKLFTVKTKLWKDRKNKQSPKVKLLGKVKH